MLSFTLAKKGGGCSFTFCGELRLDQSDRMDLITGQTAVFLTSQFNIKSQMSAWFMSIKLLFLDNSARERDFHGALVQDK